MAVYLIGILGFAFGFYLGVQILRLLLKDKSNEEILQNKGRYWLYGIFVWGTAFISAWAFVKTYQNYF